MAAAFFERHTRVRGLSVPIESRGLLPGGEPVPREAERAAAAYGAELSEHRSRHLDPVDIVDAQLILGMTRQHLREIVIADSGALARSFTLREIVQRGEAEALDPGEHAGWLETLQEGRQRRDLVGRAVDDDIADPFGGSAATYRATATELFDLTARLAALLWPDQPPSRLP
jgi:protein-tyrosine phosphatase